MRNSGHYEERQYALWWPWNVTVCTVVTVECDSMPETKRDSRIQCGTATNTSKVVSGIVVFVPHVMRGFLH
jgi:hypothetical protein